MAVDAHNIAQMALQDEKKDGVINITDADDNFTPSRMRFVVAGLLCLSSALSGYILNTYVTIW